MPSFHVYMLRCADGAYYVGHTDDLERRLLEHHHAVYPDCYTASRRPLELAFSVELATRDEARALEHKLKGWSNPKKRALARGDWTAVHLLARSRRPSRRKPLDAAPAAPCSGQSERSRG